MKIKSTFCESHPNIALIKYWGKADEKLNTPINGSLSVTLDFGTTRTEITRSDHEEFVLNGKSAQITSRLQSALDFFSKYSENDKYLIKSSNNFPTAAGFASSAAGAAAFVGALASFVGETDNPVEFWKERNVDLSELARRVSGSGCRSIYGGFVEWTPGESSNGEDSISKQLFDELHWETFSVISVSLHTKPKKVPSTLGMQQTVRTCPWMAWRAKEVVPKRIQDSRDFIRNRDFSSLAEIIMKESNELHANCAATFPPIHYLNDSSRLVIDAIHNLNNSKQRNVAAYSFDAGPNPFIFAEKENVEEVMNTIKAIKEIEIENIIEARPASGISCSCLE
ncbi:diphosphomevalonate decarboxylase family protein [Tritrichomonas foetus]|uniref:Diphosphomevalonate decarboxylase n=1 Tax=Tritrichomonas foetus TaxID=1144522 RepID=A0A1J4JY38_9EUKA|nr:diphosphomevalonate decarboxylase family protein [Tritrichomonas foetus]|eukprot:OHT04073.1 diphosphomevalonate decarboxylase family protein [Tritrichomonas foetus]